MALVGVITAGSVDRVLQSITFAAADVLVLFSREEASGHVLFEKGRIITARLGELRDVDAVAELRQWSSGHYTLIKRGQVGEGIRGNVALGIADLRARRSIGRWLDTHGYHTSVIADPQQALETIAYLQPDLLLLGCPLQMLGKTCAELSESLRKELRLPPAIVVLDVEEQTCSEPSPPCLRAPATIESIQQILTRDWTGTRLGVRHASLEQTEKITPPRRPVRRSSDRASEELLALALEQGRLTARDFLLALLVFLLGSGTIWLTILTR